MKTRDFETASLSARRLLKSFHGAKGETPAPPVAIDRSGHRLRWIERTLLAVDTDRVFIEMSDPGLREELVEAYEDQGRDVIAASNSRTLLAFMEQLPVPHDFANDNDLVIAEDDFPGTNGTDLHRQLLARGWAIPVFTISPQAPWGRTGVAS